MSLALFDDLVKSMKRHISVIPAKAGIQLFPILKNSLDSGFHRSDDFLREHLIWLAKNPITGTLSHCLLSLIYIRLNRFLDHPIHQYPHDQGKKDNQRKPEEGKRPSEELGLQREERRFSFQTLMKGAREPLFSMSDSNCFAIF